jgi:hypothetical protein
VLSGNAGDDATAALQFCFEGGRVDATATTAGGSGVGKTGATLRAKNAVSRRPTHPNCGSVDSDFFCAPSANSLISLNAFQRFSSSLSTSLIFCSKTALETVLSSNYSFIIYKINIQLHILLSNSHSHLTYNLNQTIWTSINGRDD